MRLFRLLLMVLSLGALAAVTMTPQAAASHYFSVMADYSPTGGVAPLDVRVWGAVDGGGQWPGPIAISVHFDDQAKTAYFTNQMFEFQHRFTCPGVYRVWIDEGLGGSIVRDWTIVVSTPEFGLRAESTGPKAVRLLTSDEIRAPQVTRATIDWGDGTAPEEFAWVTENGGTATPSHAYAQAGAFVVTVTNHYEDANCGFDQSSSITVTTYPTAVGAASWGKIKGLYR